MLFAMDPFRGFDRAPALPIDAYRRGDTFLVDIDLPGASPDSIEVTVDHNVLTVAAERAAEPVEGDQVITSERPRGRFTRRLRLGQALDGAGVTASYENGVLTISVPVAEAAKPRRVEITRAA